MERDGEPFRDQNRANIAAVRFQRSASATIIAGRCSFGSWRAGARNKLKIQVAIADKIAKPPRRPGSQFTFWLANRASRLWRIKTNKANVRLFLIDADRIAVDDSHVSWVDRSAKREARRKRNHCDPGKCDETAHSSRQVKLIVCAKPVICGAFVGRFDLAQVFGALADDVGGPTGHGSQQQLPKRLGHHHN